MALTDIVNRRIELKDDDQKKLEMLDSIIAVFYISRSFGVSIEFDWCRELNAFEITVRKGKIIDRVAISAYELGNMYDIIDYIKSVIKRCATEVNSAYERSTLE